MTDFVVDNDAFFYFILSGIVEIINLIDTDFVQVNATDQRANLEFKFLLC